MTIAEALPTIPSLKIDGDNFVLDAPIGLAPKNTNFVHVAINKANSDFLADTSRTARKFHSLSETSPEDLPEKIKQLVPNPISRCKNSIISSLEQEERKFFSIPSIAARPPSFQDILPTPSFASLDLLTDEVSVFGSLATGIPSLSVKEVSVTDRMKEFL
ncbi:hypothetical protein RCL1_008431 [Eukaryota sp. TZLM3-RCL]